MNDEPVRSKRRYSTKSHRRAQGGKTTFLHSAFLVSHRGTEVTAAQREFRAGARGCLRTLGFGFAKSALRSKASSAHFPSPQKDVESALISSHAGYGVEPHFLNPLCAAVTAVSLCETEPVPAHPIDVPYAAADDRCCGTWRPRNAHA